MDYAKHSKQAPPRKQVPGWIWFLTGVVTGVFASFLFYLDQGSLAKPVAIDDVPIARVVKPEEVIRDIKLDFYDILPNYEVPVEEYGLDNEKMSVAEDAIYVLQVGSFQQLDDADSLRARLILLGLDAYVKKSQVKGEFWHRVLVGPIKTDLLLNRTQDTLAGAGLEAIPLRVRM